MQTLCTDAISCKIPCSDPIVRIDEFCNVHGTDISDQIITKEEVVDEGVLFKAFHESTNVWRANNPTNPSVLAMEG